MVHIRQIEEYAKDNNIPIMEHDGIEFMLDYIKKNNIKNILEIGTAIGYSAIRMCLVDDFITVTTIERDEKRYKEALKNIRACGMDKRIDVVFDDALDVNLAGYKYDLIFIDAAKGQNIKFFEKFKNYLNDGGIIITDNVNFHGLVKNPEKIESKNVRQLVDKIIEYRKYLEDHDEYLTKFYDIGDGLAISFKKNDEKAKSIN
jgi:predicted O-methyltransferase YrrM